MGFLIRIKSTSVVCAVYVGGIEVHQNCATMQLVQLRMFPSCHSVSGAVLWICFSDYQIIHLSDEWVTIQTHFFYLH